MHPLDDVITAIATPTGEGGIAVIRLSGEQAFRIADCCFRGKKPLADSQTHTAHFGTFVNEKRERVDDVVATVFRSPHSYTGENSVELSCHGGVFVARTIVETLIRAGARQAEPGEFTKRAFLNGRMDLSQAEAVADLIHAQSDAAQKLSLSQLHGRLSHKIDELREKLLGVCGLLELELDFVEEGISIVSQSQVSERLNSVVQEIDSMIKSYRAGRMSREGVSVAIIGEPNVGKSSIFNNLIDYNRAIVTPVAGTTRDSIEENAIIDGVLFKLVDTAGIRPTTDIVESEGIKRTYSAIEEADIILFVRDSTRIDEEIFLNELRNLHSANAKIVEVLNKYDLIGFLQDRLPDIHRGMARVPLSAKTGFGLEQLRKALVESTDLQGVVDSDESVMVTNFRHVACLGNAKKALDSALASLLQCVGNELVASDIRRGISDLEMIVGRVTSDDILNHIFSKFCIGK